MRDYRYKIDFLKRVQGYDEFGEPVDEWQTHISGIWASYEPLLGMSILQRLLTIRK